MTSGCLLFCYRSGCDNFSGNDYGSSGGHCLLGISEAGEHKELSSIATLWMLVLLAWFLI